MAASLPTIVVVVFDTARLDRFGCYVNGGGYTPTVDWLAREGLRVETMISNGPWTQPSHGSLFTGLYPTQHGCQWQTGNRLRDSAVPTMAQWLRGLGYETVCATNNGLISPRTGLARGFRRYASRLDLERGLRRFSRRMRKALAGGDSGGRIVNAWIRRTLGEAGRPLFLFVNYVEPHWSYAPPRRLERRVDGPRFGFVEGLRYRLGIADRVGPWEAVARADPRTLGIYATLYSGEHLNVDAHLAALLDVLSQTGRMDGETIVIVTSDHGEHLGEHGLADHHASLDDHLVRVPFVAWGPGIIPAGVNRRLSEFVDVLPSLARLLDVDPPAAHLSDRRGDVFAPNPAGDGEVAFAEWRSWTEKERARLARRNPSYDFSGLGRDLVCVRDERYKLVRTASDGEVLHDLLEDPQEETDVSSAHPEIASRLGRHLDAAIDSWSAWEEPTTVSDHERKEIEQQLSELGYI